MVNLLAGVGPRRGRVIDAAGIGREIAATMSDDQFEVGVVVQHAAKDQMMDGDRRIERVADDIDQVVIGKALLVTTKAGGSTVHIQFSKRTSQRLARLHKVSLLLRLVVRNASRKPTSTTVLSSFTLTR